MAQLVKYDVHTTRKIKFIHDICYHILLFSVCMLDNMMLETFVCYCLFVCLLLMVTLSDQCIWLQLAWLKMMSFVTPSLPTMLLNCPLQVSQLGQLSLSSFRGRQMSSGPVYRMCVWWRHLVNAYRIISLAADCSHLAPRVAASCLAKLSCYTWPARRYSLCCPAWQLVSVYTLY